MQVFPGRPGLPTTKRWSTLGLIAIAALALCWTACDAGTRGHPAPGGGAGEGLDRFQFTRASQLLVRIDSKTGQVWFVPHSGDGGWTPVGDAPDAAGKPAHPGRYRIYNLEPGRRGMGESPQRMLRVDGETGRAWTIELLDGASWIGIDEPEGPVAGGGPAQTPTPAPAATNRPAARATTPTGQPMTAAELGIVSREKIASDEEGAAEFAKNLVQALSKDGMPPDVQAWSARQLGQFPKEVAVPPLLEALKSEHPVVVVAAIRALKETGDTSTIPEILKLEKHPDPSVRAAVQEAVVEVQ